MIDQELQEFKQKLVKQNKPGLVLDIDETLSWTVSYWVEQLQQRFGNPENLSIIEIIAKYKYAQNVPYWQSKEAQDWMEAARESNAFQENLPLIENSNNIVERINKIVPIVGYLTIRPRKVIPGTQRWLQKHRFPQVDILARPNTIPSADGNKWKAAVLNFLYPQIIGIIDDNPAVVSLLPPDYAGRIYLYDSDVAPAGKITVFPCKTWSDVYTQVKQSFLAKQQNP
ncbi:hypothetical protein M1116_01980 [Patescibacteria group bacterium]|nr:hypothetical protein [Patescibacteria group bacterium]